MRPRRASASPVKAAEPVPDWLVWCGIDPGSPTGLVALAVPNTGPDRFRIDRARFVGSASVSPSVSKSYTNAGAKGTLLARVRDRLLAWRVTNVVVEENSGVRAGGGAASVGVQGAGTLFGQGVTFGLCVGAAVALPWPVKLWSYPPTTPPKSRRRTDLGEPVFGWQSGRGRIPPRELTIARGRALIRAAKERPGNGVLPTAAELAREHNEHEAMAVGVLNYHLLRERGTV
jgi:hypothetical protein